MANLYNGKPAFCRCCQVPFQWCKCKKTDVGKELLYDLGLSLERPVSHHQIKYINDDIEERERKRGWTDQEQLQIVLNQQRQLAGLEEARKVYNQPSFVGRLVKLYRDIRLTKLFRNIGKDNRDD